MTAELIDVLKNLVFGAFIFVIVLVLFGSMVAIAKQTPRRRLDNDED